MNDQTRFDIPEMNQYFDSLPVDTQLFILQSSADISTLGELKQIGEHFRLDH